MAAQVASQSRKVVLSCDLSHETNTFSALPTSWKNFQEQQFLLDEVSIAKHHRGTKSTLGASYEKADEYNWDLVVPVAASANPAGRVLREVCEDLFGRLTSTCERARPDGILLHLHGAMVGEHTEDCEGELLERLRHIVGTRVPIFVTLDLHGNITPRMAENASCLIAVRTYPHIDFYETALRAADLLQRTLRGEIEPVTVLAKRPQLSGLDGGKTTLSTGPMCTILRRGEEFERCGKCLVVSVCAGFTAADIFDVGPSVTVTFDAINGVSRTEAQQIAEGLMDYVWETREFRSEVFLTVDEAVARMSSFCRDRYAAAQKPLVVADVTDNPGSGHYGDATNLLRAMICANDSGKRSPPLRQVVFYAIYDPRAVRHAVEQIGVGRAGVLTMGGNFDVAAGGAPLTVRGRVVSVSDGRFQTWGPMGFGGQWQNFGLCVLFRVASIVDAAALSGATADGSDESDDTDGEIDVVLISNNGQLLDTAQITSLGVDLAHKQIVCVKSKQHFRACLTPLADEIVAVDGGGLGHQILCGGEYKHVRRPIWPLDEV